MDAASVRELHCEGPVEDPSNTLNSPQIEGPTNISSRILQAEPEDFFLSAQGELILHDKCVATLLPGKALTTPHLRPLTDDPQSVKLLEEVLAFLLAQLLEPLKLEAKAPLASDTPLLRSLGEQLSAALGSVRTREVQGLVRALSGAGRELLAQRHLVVGRRHTYLHQNIDRKAVITRLGLLSTFRSLKAPDRWKPAQVLLLDQASGLTHLSAKDFERLGYELFSGRAVRVDIVERVIAPSFAQKSPTVFPSLMHSFRCTEEEARAFAKQLKIGGPPEKQGRKTRADQGRTKAGRNRSGGKKSGFR